MHHWQVSTLVTLYIVSHLTCTLYKSRAHAHGLPTQKLLSKSQVPEIREAGHASTHYLFGLLRSPSACLAYGNRNLKISHQNLSPFPIFPRIQQRHGAWPLVWIIATIRWKKNSFANSYNPHRGICVTVAAVTNYIWNSRATNDLIIPL